MCRFVSFLNEHFRAVIRAFDFMLALRDLIKNAFEKSLCYKRNGERAAVGYRVIHALGRFAKHSRS